MTSPNHSSRARLTALFGASLFALTFGSGCLLVAEDDDAFCSAFDDTCIDEDDSTVGTGGAGGAGGASAGEAGGNSEGGGAAAGGDDTGASTSGSGGAGGSDCNTPGPICAPGFECGGLSSCTEECFGEDCCQLTCVCENGTLSCDLKCK